MLDKIPYGQYNNNVPNKDRGEARC